MDKSNSKDENMLKIFKNVHESAIKVSEEHKFLEEGEENPV
jgi:hypothetical protein